MTTPIATYLQDEILAMLIRDTFRISNPLQARIDTIWQNILDSYLREDKFMTETQAEHGLLIETVV